MPVVHSDDVAVDVFAAAMKEKLAKAREKGRAGWEDTDDFSNGELVDQLFRHIVKGDPLDVANYCMFLHHREESFGAVEHRIMSLGLWMMTDMCHKASYDAGWWHVKLPDGTSVDMKNSPDHPFYPYFVATKMMLTVSEVSEEMEGFRRDLPDDKLPQFSSEATELCDELIRIFDRAGARGIDLVPPFFSKMTFNGVRPDHKPEARAKSGGKKF